MAQPNAADDGIVEEIEQSIPDERKNLSFGGPGESIIDVMDQADRDAHKRGLHDEQPRDDCPLCEVGQ